MVKIILSCLVLVFLLLTPAQAKYYDADVPADFKRMLQNPTVNHPGEHLATRVTRPFVKEPTRDVNFFSDPKTHRPQWDAENGSSIKPINIFNTMGISRRGLSNDAQHARYKRITDAQALGMLRVVSGQAFGLKGTVATAVEQDIMAKELLNIGLMAGGALPGRLAELEAAYTSGGLTAGQKKHLQMCALLLLRGGNLSTTHGEWYLRDIERRSLAKIDGYAARFLPHDETHGVAGAGAGGFPDNPKDVLISPLQYGTEGQVIYGTPGIKGSALNASLDHARYPNIMVLGSHKVPMKEPGRMFSISAQVAPNHYFVIMRPEDGRAPPVLRPHYMEVNAVDSSAAEGRGKTNVQVRYLDDTTEDLAIHWEVEKGSKERTALPGEFRELRGALRSSVSQVKPKQGAPNDGQLTISPARKIINDDDEETYSLIAILKGAQEKRFYYWCPTPSQMGLLETFSKRQSAPFKLDDLYNHMRTFDEYTAVPERILGQIQALLAGNLEGFQR